MDKHNVNPKNCTSLHCNSFYFFSKKSYEEILDRNWLDDFDMRKSPIFDKVRCEFWDEHGTNIESSMCLKNCTFHF